MTRSPKYPGHLNGGRTLNTVGVVISVFKEINICLILECINSKKFVLQEACAFKLIEQLIFVHLEVSKLIFVVVLK